MQLWSTGLVKRRTACEQQLCCCPDGQGIGVALPQQQRLQLRHRTPGAAPRGKVVASRVLDVADVK